MAWWNDYDRGDYGRWAARYDSAYWNRPEGRAFGFGAGSIGYRGGYDRADYSRYGEDYTPRVAPSESPAYGREADRLLRRDAYDAGYTLQPRGGRMMGMEGGWRGERQGSWRQDEWNGRSGWRGGESRGYGADYGGYGTGRYSAGAYGGSAGEGYGGGYGADYGRRYGRYDRGYRW